MARTDPAQPSASSSRQWPWTAPDDAGTLGEQVPARGPARPPSGLGLTEPAIAAVLLACGVLVALLWRALAPGLARLSDGGEQAAAVDGALGLVELVAGLVTAGAVLIRPGRRPTLRVLAAILGSVAGSCAAWWIGDLIGRPALRAVTVAAVWPLATSAAVCVGAVLPLTSRRIDQAEAAAVRRRSPRRDPFEI